MGRVDRLIDRSTNCMTNHWMHKVKVKAEKASRLRKRSDKLSEKVRDVACKINSRGKKVCKRGGRKRRSGFNTHHPTKRRNRF